ncbi:MAG: N-acetylneuraminate synthase family protein [Nitrososphaerales archaeon]|uniref:N-acetylneuraminate synthase (NeuB) n=1 Tax=uncultured marine thaumarchaeote KM3_100_D10 TaxID=1455979 RepID=A0A075G605_9ARCH|nr:N-acetylneuraminate synthase (neuB) [uncultured marine thaumarchaeote KM3_100_D10]
MTKIIAELCQNHNGDVNILKDMIWRAADSGASHVKIQTIFSEDLTLRERFEEGVTSNGVVKSIKRPYLPEFERLSKLDLGFDTHALFIDECSSAGVIPLTTVFNRSRLESIVELGFKEIKIASYDCASFPLINDLKNKFNHIYVSTGATHDSEIETTANILSDQNFSFLHCVTIYPTPVDKLNLNRIDYLRQFTNSVGFSDHTRPSQHGIDPDIVALWKGADVIERHFTILDSSQTKDGPVSINPEQLKNIVDYSKYNHDELSKLVENISDYDKMLGSKTHSLSEEELLNRDYYRGRFASKINGKTIYNWEES